MVILRDHLTHRSESGVAGSNAKIGLKCSVKSIYKFWKVSFDQKDQSKTCQEYFVRYLEKRLIFSFYFLIF